MPSSHRHDDANSPCCCILGGGGFLGRHIAQHFARVLGYRVRILDVAFAKDVFGVTDAEDERSVELRAGSILDRKAVEDALKGCDVAVLMAAYGIGGRSSLDRAVVFRVNVDGARLVLDCCRRAGVKRLLYTSTVAVVFKDRPLFNSREDEPYAENHYSHYAASKAAAERLILAENDDTFRVCVLRLRGIYAAGEPRTVERALHAIFERYVVFFAAPGEPSPDPRTHFSGLHNVLKALELADTNLRRSNSSAAGKVYNIVDEGHVGSWSTWLPFFDALGRSKPFHVPFNWLLSAVKTNQWLAERIPYFPLPVTQLEVYLSGVSNTYSIEAAKRDLGYAPEENNSIGELAIFYRRRFARKTAVSSRLIFMLAVVLVMVFFKIVF